MVAKGVCLILLGLVCYAAAVTPFTAKDMHSLARLGAIAPTPDDGVVYSVSQWVRAFYLLLPSFEVPSGFGMRCLAAHENFLCVEISILLFRPDFTL